ncbi:MAG: hypothetical protein AAGG08_15260 [Actinomycetota bacterium]
MFRRVAVLLAVVALSGCSTFSDGDAIARVNDTELSPELLDDLTTVIGPQADAVAGTGQNADAVRALISEWIQVSVVTAHLAEWGVADTAAARAAGGAAIDADPTLVDISDGARAYLLEAQALIVTFNQLPDPQASFEAALAASDIVVDARYGTFDPVFGVIPTAFVPPTGGF